MCDFPTPASPTTAATWPCPTGLLQGLLQRLQLMVTPYKPFSPTRCAACKRPRMTLTPAARTPPQLRPALTDRPRAFTRTTLATSRSVRAVAGLLPGVASCCHACSQCVVRPPRPSSPCADHVPMRATTTSPALSPIRSLAPPVPWVRCIPRHNAAMAALHGQRA